MALINFGKLLMVTNKAFINFEFAAEDANHAAHEHDYAITTALIAAHAATLGIDPTHPPAPAVLDEVARELLLSLSQTTITAPPPRLVFDPPQPAPASRMTFILYATATPRAAENFARLCDGMRGVSRASGKPLHYKATPVHRIVPGYCVQWGDVVRGDGSAGESIYGGAFKDEPAGLKLAPVRGSLVMANSGKNSNTSQVFVVLSTDALRLKKNIAGKHVVFGHVAGFGDGDVMDESARESIKVMERFDAATENTIISIRDCGVL
ncbi:hypothetical protein HK100_010028 [Physocladia obscura]|uniref:Peptidyl-prolyl cis-trans isomerase n=1 Tax=Physocladia obscura TaxID=109957 RepID=A0AAD5T3Y1_9FUNG|nr:hypothetical protein HK100_010028 [Physocladia obscura]